MIVTNIEYLTLKRTHEELTVNDEGFDIDKIKSFDSTPPVLDGLVNILLLSMRTKLKLMINQSFVL